MPLRQKKLWSRIVRLIYETQSILQYMKNQDTGFQTLLMINLNQKIRRLEGMALTLQHYEAKETPLNLNDLEHLYSGLQAEIEAAYRGWIKQRSMPSWQSNDSLIRP